MFLNRSLLISFCVICIIFLVISCDQIIPVHTTVVDGPIPSASIVRDSRITPSQFPQIGTPIPTTPTVELIDVSPSSLRGTIIHIWHSWPGPGGKAVHSMVEDFNLHNEWGIIAVPVAYDSLDELGTELEEIIKTSDQPDIAVGYPHQYLEWDDALGLLDLGTYISDPVWGYSLDEQADFPPVIWEQDMLDGKRFGMPAQRSAQVLYYNQTWAQSLGFSAEPSTPEQFIEQACAAAHQYKDLVFDSSQRAEPVIHQEGIGGWMVSTQYPAVLSWIYSFGGEVVHSPEPGQGQTVYDFDNPQVEETFTFLRGLYDQLCAWQPESQYPIEEFASRKSLFYTGSVMEIPDLNSAFRKAENRDRWTVIPFPSTSSQPAMDVYGPSYVVLTSTPQRQLAAWLLLKWMLSPSNHALLVEETSAFPLRESVMEHLVDFQNRNPQWITAVSLLPLGRPEPLFRSWGTVRWALTDASTQLFRDYFNVDQVPALIEFLDQTASELHLGLGPSDLSATPTKTP